MNWVYVGKEQAMRHKLYGVGGWLLLLQIIVVVGLLASLGTASTFEDHILAGGYIPPHLNPAKFVDYLYFLVFLNAAQAVAFFCLLYFKPKNSRKILIVLSAANLPIIFIVSVLFGSYQDFHYLYFRQENLYSVLTYLVWTVVLVGYFYKSKRVRCTFDHSVKQSDVSGYEFESVSGSSWSAANGIKAIDTSSLSDADWQQISQQFANERDEGLWTRLFVKHEGNESAAKLEYFKVKAEKITENLTHATASPVKEVTLEDLAVTLRKSADQGRQIGMYKYHEISGYFVLETLDYFIFYKTLEKLRAAVDSLSFYDAEAPDVIKKIQR